MAVGGIDCTGHDKKPMKILIRWTKNADTAERQAKDVFNNLLATSFSYAEKKCFIVMTCTAPIPLGTDEKGIYEYALEFTLFYER